MTIKGVFKRIRRAIVKFFFQHLNNKFRVFVWKRMGVKMGKGCRISCMSFSPESYLIELGDNVIIAEYSYLITHEGSVCVFHNENPNIDLFGKITIGSNTFIGMHCLILPNTTIGSNCIIGSGSVVRGKIPDNSVVIGNPGKIVTTVDEYKKNIFKNPALYEYKKLSDKEKKRILLEKYNKN